MAYVFLVMTIGEAEEPFQTAHLIKALRRSEKISSVHIFIHTWIHTHIYICVCTLAYKIYKYIYVHAYIHIDM